MSAAALLPIVTVAGMSLSVAAGYAFGRSWSRASLDAEQITPIPQSPTASLKRKRMHAHDENNNSLEYPHNLAAIYPNKRTRTPSASPEPEVEPTKEQEEPTPIPAREANPVSEPQSPPAQVQEIKASSPVVPARAIHPISTPQRTAALGGGFASYSQSPSAFSSLSSSSLKSPGPSATWLEAIGAQRRESNQKTTVEALALPPAVKPSTGEEDEEIACELKGLKLFLKRGAREFNSPIGGHGKVLISRQKATKRILFRREPLWQVTMNLRLTSHVKCSFDDEDGVLRVVCLEDQETQQCSADLDKTQALKEVVVYAFKRGRFTSKDAFTEFAQGVLRVVKDEGDAKKQDEDEPKNEVNEDDEKADGNGEPNVVANTQAVDA
ncbi:hypothetical protein BDZ89DRAFT_1074658 [Hymenopellis radicata]|nr:hypothetical protein BDZ89DRAFT_1074658 [Hymenopellis radicata]